MYGFLTCFSTFCLLTFHRRTFYFFCVSIFERFYYDDRSYPFGLFYYQFDSDIPLYEYERYIVYSVSSAFSFTIDSASSSSSYFTYSMGGRETLLYDKTTGQFDYYSQHSSTFDPSVDINFVDGNRHIYYQDSNLTDFPFYDGVFHPGGNTLKVDVRFRPGLSGQVDRMLDNGDGTKSMVSQMRMTVVNNSRFPIQYKMYIMKKNRSSSRGGNLGAQHVNEKYDDDPVFIYYSNEWVYSNNLNNSQDWYNGHIQKQNKSTEWHYVGAGGSISVLFNYSQIKLVENEEYTCIVEAVRNDYDCASRMFVYHATSEAAYPEYKQIWGDDKVAVYQSDFTMIHYSDVKYDPNDTSNGVNPYGSYGDSLNYEWGYNAVDEGNGNVDYNSKNLFKDKNSWYNTQYNPNGIVVPGSYSSSGSSSFDNLSGTLSGYFNFVSSVLGYFPGPVVSVFSFGVTAIVIVAFFKWVFK